MQGDKQAVVPQDEFDKAIANLQDLVATAQRGGKLGSDTEQPAETAAAETPTTESRSAAEPAAAGAQGLAGAGAAGFSTSGFAGGAGSGLAAPAPGGGRPPRLTDVLATGIHEATQSVHELIDANRSAHAHLFGPVGLPPRPGAPRPASSVTADGHLAGAMWQLRESIKELQAVSQALLSRI